MTGYEDFILSVCQDEAVILEQMTLDGWLDEMEAPAEQKYIRNKPLSTPPEAPKLNVETFSGQVREITKETPK